MAEENNDAREYQQSAEPALDLRALDRLVGEWRVSGDAQGSVTYEWMEGGFFLIQRVAFLKEDGTESKGMEVIGHERSLGAEPSAEIKSRFYSDTGDTLDYTYELEGDTLTIWFGDRGSPAYYKGEFSSDDDILSGHWHWPGGGYEATSTRVE